MAKYTDARYPEKINDLVDNDGNVNITAGGGGYPVEINFADLLEENSEARDILANYLQDLSGEDAGTFVKLTTQDKATLEGYYYVQTGENLNYNLFASYNNKYYFISITTSVDDAEMGTITVTINDI